MAEKEESGRKPPGTFRRKRGAMESSATTRTSCSAETEGNNSTQSPSAPCINTASYAMEGNYLLLPNFSSLKRSGLPLASIASCFVILPCSASIFRHASMVIIPLPDDVCMMDGI